MNARIAGLFGLAATGPDAQVVRVAPFGMTGFETIAEAAAIVDAGAWPGDMSEAQLDSAYEPLGLMPYEIWKYSRQRNLKYVFMHLTRFGNYQLIYTDDRCERSRPDWEELLGADGLKDLEQNN